MSPGRDPPGVAGQAVHLVCPADRPDRGPPGVERHDRAPYHGLPPPGGRAGAGRAERLRLGPRPGELAGAALRFLRSIDTGADRRVLAPLYLREMVYRVLQREQYSRLLAIAAAESASNPVSAVLEYVRARLRQVGRDRPDQHRLGHLRGAVVAEVPGDLAGAHRVPDQRDAVQAELVDQHLQVGRERVPVVAAGGLARLARAAAVVGDHPVAGREQRRHLLVPGPPAERVAVDEDDRRAAAVVLVVEVDGARVLGPDVHDGHRAAPCARTGRLFSPAPSLPSRADHSAKPVTFQWIAAVRAGRVGVTPPPNGGCSGWCDAMHRF